MTQSKEVSIGKNFPLFVQTPSLLRDFCDNKSDTQKNLKKLLNLDLV